MRDNRTKVYILHTHRDTRKAMSKGNSKALTSLRQKLRKYTKDFEKEIAKFRENPDLPDDDEEAKGEILFSFFWLQLWSFILPTG